MEQTKACAGLARWLAALEYNMVRRIETPPVPGVTIVRNDNGLALRGVLIADDLYLTRKREFFRITNGTIATAMTIEEVAESYDLESLRHRYKELQDEWKQSRRVTS